MMTRRKLFRLAALSALLIQSGCATLSKDECLKADWYRIGREDGANGYVAERIEDHRKACGEFGISPNPAAYRKGRDDGLLFYCTPASGYEHGKSGASYRYVCPPQLEANFMRGFRVGMQVYDLTQQILQVEGKIRAKEKELGKDKLPDEQRRTLRDHLRDLERERHNLTNLRQSIEVMAIF